ncbi:TRI39 ligase, partial [Pycnonotus jocosus]|nr:TRI39 ligase [Pycnonotus jocosus]
ARFTLDPLTSHPRLVLSRDNLSALWCHGGPEPAPSPERFSFSPCALGGASFTCGRHTWTVTWARAPFCAVGVTRASAPRNLPAAPFSPEGGIWAVQRWGGLARALTEPPT